jgi:hypothetical protein
VFRGSRKGGRITYRLEILLAMCLVAGLRGHWDAPVTNLKGIVTRSSSSDILAVLMGWYGVVWGLLRCCESRAVVL